MDSSGLGALCCDQGFQRLGVTAPVELAALVIGHVSALFGCDDPVGLVAPAVAIRYLRSEVE
jgi:hypothetical protein